MNLPPTSWYVRYFFWCCSVFDHFWFTEGGRMVRGRYWKYQDGTNLCSFFRMLLFGTLIAAAVVSSYLGAIFVALILPFILFGWMSVGFLLMIVCAVITGFIALLLGIWGVCILVKRAADALNQRAERRAYDPSPTPSFWSVVCTYWTAIHNRICPIVAFKSNQNQKDDRP